jgi:hypothetical protein
MNLHTQKHNQKCLYNGKEGIYLFRILMSAQLSYPISLACASADHFEKKRHLDVARGMCCGPVHWLNIWMACEWSPWQDH